ncbi:MAG: GAF domain-containing sensor histidine kinase [Actinomycetota bacterium]|nr:GAF domain-containing sensor histidine kinase [Actinomycetota bacterium]
MAWSWWALSVALTVASLFLELLTPDFLSPRQESPGAVFAVGSALLALACPTLGALIASRRPVNLIGWIFCGVGFLYGVRSFAWAYAHYALFVRPSLPGEEYAAWISTWLRFSGLIPLLVLLVLLFPHGRLPSPRWRFAVGTVIGGAVMLALGDALRFGPLLTYYYVYNPFGITEPIGGTLSAHQLVEAFSIVGGVLLLTSCFAAILALVLRLRRARGQERQQLKWFAYAAIPAVVGSTVILLNWTIERSALMFLDKTVLPLLRIAPSFVLLVGERRASRTAELRLDLTFEFLTTVAILLVPICTGVAIRKHRLYATELAGSMRELVLAIWTVRWPRVLLAGAVAGVLPLAFIYLAVYAYVILYPVLGHGAANPEQLEKIVTLVNGWGAHAAFLAITFAMAWWAARKVGTRPAMHGTLVGLVAAVVNQALVSTFYPPVTIAELPIYFLLGIAGGWLGGVGGRTTLTGEVYRASRRIGAASDPDAVAAAIGEHLGRADLHGITLWRATSRGGEAERVPESKPAQEFVLWGSWSPHGEEVWLFPARPNEAKTPIVTPPAEGPSVVRTSSLPADERAHWERMGIDCTLLIPLLAPGDVHIGVLMATFRKRRRFSKATVRAYLTVGAQAALALENMRLVEEARQTGVLLERQRLAREIHDTLAQGFTGIITNLSAAQLAQPPASANGASTHHLEVAKRIARESLAEARRFVWALRPEWLDRRSLSEALDKLAMEWSEETGVEARTVVTGVPRALLPEVEVALFRTAQEALTNISKHARAERANVTLSYMNDRVVLDIMDNGVGFEPARLQERLGTQDVGGFGLVAIRERIKQLGGTLRVESKPGEGTTLAAELPIAAQEAKSRGPNARKPEAAE